MNVIWSNIEGNKIHQMYLAADKELAKLEKSNIDARYKGEERQTIFGLTVAGVICVFVLLTFSNIIPKAILWSVFPILIGGVILYGLSSFGTYLPKRERMIYAGEKTVSNVLDEYVDIIHILDESNFARGVKPERVDMTIEYEKPTIRFYGPERKYFIVLEKKYADMIIQGNTVDFSVLDKLIIESSAENVVDPEYVVENVVVNDDSSEVLLNTN